MQEGQYAVHPESLGREATNVTTLCLHRREASCVLMAVVTQGHTSFVSVSVYFKVFIKSSLDIRWEYSQVRSLHVLHSCFTNHPFQQYTENTDIILFLSSHLKLKNSEICGIECTIFPTYCTVKPILWTSTNEHVVNMNELKCNSVKVTTFL